MMEQLNHQSRRDRFGSKINRDHSPILMFVVPWLSIMLGSLTPLLPIIAPAPILPPMGYLLLLSWRMLRPGSLPLWAGFPLGMFDDMFSGQPLGSGILLFSLTLIALDLLELRFPWRRFWQNWIIAALFMFAYLVVAALVSGARIELLHLTLLVPQLLLSLTMFPILMALANFLDWVRLLRVWRTS